MKRINPHQIIAGFIAPSGLKRIAYDRLENNDYSLLSAQEKHAIATDKILATRSLVTVKEHIIVCLQAKNGELNFHDKEVLMIGQALINHQPDPNSTALTAVVYGELNTNELLKKCGVDRIINIEFDFLTNYGAEQQAESLSNIINKINPLHTLLPESEWGESDIARRITIKTQLSYASDVVEIQPDQLTRLVDNDRLEATNTLTKIISLKPSLVTGEIDFECDALALEMDDIEMSISANEQPTYRLSSESIPLVEAPLILSAGNGVQDFELFEQCAQSLDASVAGSRVVVDNGILPRDKQVGATGKTVFANVYIALGISGAIQHLQGIQQCKTVIAVNTDDTCAMIKRADLSIIADADAVMQELIQICAENQPQILVEQSATDTNILASV